MSKLTRRPSQRIGYVRISTLDRDPEHQIKALEEAGCDAIYADRVSGAPGIARSWEKPLIISRRTTRWGTLGDVVELVELLGPAVYRYLVNIEKARTPAT